jgi:hypothetical protein
MAPSRWPIILITGFCAFLTLIYTLAQIQPAPIVSLGVVILPFLSCAWWVSRDARLHRIAFAQDWGLFAWIFWPLLIPWYGWRTRGRRAWPLVLGLYAAILAPYIVAFAGYLISPMAANSTK